MSEMTQNQYSILTQYLNEKIEQIIQHQEDGFCLFNDQFNIEFCNQEAKALLDIKTLSKKNSIPLNSFGIYELDSDKESQTIESIQSKLKEGKTIRSDKAYLLRPDGSQILISYSISPIITSTGFQYAVWIFRDIQELYKLKKIAEQQTAQFSHMRNHFENELKDKNFQIAYHERHDPLTGLMNHQQFEKELEKTLMAVQFFKVEHTLIFCDLDQFKSINNTSGYLAGDELLKEVATIIKKQINRHDLIARLAGDEFVILLSYKKIFEAEKLAQKIISAIQDHVFIWENKPFKLSISAGIIPLNHQATDIVQLMIKADTACHLAKKQGGNHYHVYHENDIGTLMRNSQLKWVTEIRRALAEDRFELYCQEITSLDKKSQQKKNHVEILIRMRDNNEQLILPTDFIQAAENYHLMPLIDEWVVTQTCKLLYENKDQLNCFEMCGINLSAQSIISKRFKESIIEILKKYEIPHEKICFEITETTAISNFKVAIEFIQAMKKQGCHFALDDFGNGVSSFAYLKNLPVDFVKIDGLFIKDISNNPIDYAMVRSINEIGHIMGKKTIAEFVENEHIKEKITDLGLDFAQGYHIDTPKPFKNIFKNK